MSQSAARPKPKRLVSLDAYRGFVMLAMASSGFALHNTWDTHHEAIVAKFADTRYANIWERGWETLSYQFSHVEWTGCSFWDLIQPSFMFMVGVSMPYSYSRREAKGQSGFRRFGHVIFRSIVLILLGVFLSSNWNSQTNFTFTNVLAQIGLGYTFLYLLLGRHFYVQLAAAIVVLGGYWYYFYQYNIPDEKREQIIAYREHVDGLKQEKDPDFQPQQDWDQFTGLASHWNKHTNAAAAEDRRLLNAFPRKAEAWNGRQFWVNAGGYQTLNFIPSLATMIFGLMAGQLLRSHLDDDFKFRRLMMAGLCCFVVAMAVDTTIWPVRDARFTWTLCPAVKRIWTPSWAVFSAGWTLWILAAFYWIIDLKGFKRLAFPLAVVGMNSIAMYCMAQLLKPWISATLKIHLQTVDALCNTQTVHYLFGEKFVYAGIYERIAQVTVLWLICLWMYRRKIFIRI